MVSKTREKCEKIAQREKNARNCSILHYALGKNARPTHSVIWALDMVHSCSLWIISINCHYGRDCAIRHLHNKNMGGGVNLGDRAR